MYVIIVGSGTFGKPLAHKISSQSHETVIVEKNEQKAKEIASEIDGLVINGDATESGILEEAGIERSDVVVSTVSDNSVNVLVTLLAKEYDVPKSVAVANSDEYEKILKSVGADIVERPRDLVSDRITHNISYPDFESFLELSDDTEIVTIELSPKSELVDKQLRNLNSSNIPDNTLIVAITRDEEVIIPRGDTQIKSGDKLAVVASADDLSDIQKVIDPD